VYVAAEGDASCWRTRRLSANPGFEPTAFSTRVDRPWPVSAAVLATLTRLGSVLSEQFELAGLFGVDFMLDGEQVWTLRLIRAYTASVEIVERLYGC